MIYVFEGIDKVGKTTLASMLSQKIDIPVLRVFKEPDIIKLEDKMFPHKMNDYFEDIVIMDILSQLKTSVILDRSLPSAYVYRIARGEYRPDLELLEWWFNRLKQNGGLYIWVTADSGFQSMAFGNNNKTRYSSKVYGEMEVLFGNFYQMFYNNGVNCSVIVNKIGAQEEMLDIISNIELSSYAW